MISCRPRGLRVRLPRLASSRHTAQLHTLGIRREDSRRIWERRVALTPEAVSSLIRDGKDVEVEVESCQRRCFSDDLYSKAGATIVPKLSANVDTVIGIKEPPVDQVQALINEQQGRQRTWMVFSHTHKGQTYNVPLLSAFLDDAKSQTLVDHELLTKPMADGALKRVAAFGWYAGAVGAGEALSMTGLSLLKRGIASPLLHLARPYVFSDLKEYKKGLERVGDKIRNAPSSGHGPIVIGLTGAGNVSTGARDMLDAMGVTWVQPSELPSIKTRPTNQIYACAVPPSAYFERRIGGAYSREDYYANPVAYHSTFSKKVAPYLTTLINGAGWRPGFPRVITSDDMNSLIASSSGIPRLCAVQDVTCDLKGNLEFVDRHTTIDDPYFEGPAGILISTVDILPTELAKDASEHFSEKILPYVRHVVTEQDSVNEVTETLERGKIVSRGVLQPAHDWLGESVAAHRRELSERAVGRRRKKKVLLLGSGLVAGPAVDVFAGRSDVHLVIASNNVAEARGLVKDRTNVEPISLDVSDETALSNAVANADVVASLLPAPMHVRVAQHCINHGKHFVTASYVSPEMKALDQSAKQSDIVILGECGLDPGIDSMAAMKILDRVQREGKKVTSFVSWCGGLPEPGASNVPLAYKFSWSPKGVLTASQNDARFKLDGQIREIAGKNLLKDHFPSVKLWKGLSLEGLANRDSIPYADKYGLGEVGGLKDLFRGTLRYSGFADLLNAFRQLGLISSTRLSKPPETWQDFLAASISLVTGDNVRPGDVASVIKSSGLSHELIQETTDALQWFSLLPGSSAISLAVPHLQNAAPIDYFAHLLSHKLAYAPHERDSALLHHHFKLCTPTGGSEEVSASLLCFGGKGGSAMSVTVGKTLAFAALRVADGHVRERGVKGPYEQEVWGGVLDSLEEAGVRVQETWSK